MTKIVFLLAGNINSTVISRISIDDIILCWPEFDISLVSHCNTVIPIVGISTKQQRHVSDWLGFIYSKNKSSRKSRYILSFFNDYYSYSLKPLLAAIFTLKRTIEEYSISEVVVITVSSNSKNIPMFGFQTTESKRGSPNLLKSRLANLLPKIFSNIKISYVYVSGDLLCKESFRRGFILTANFIFILIFILKIILLRFYSNFKEKKEFVYLVRTNHQARFLENLIFDGKVGVCIFPQVSSGSIRELKNIVNFIPKNIPIMTSSFKDIYLGIMKTIADIRLIRNKENIFTFESLTVDGLVIPFNLQDLYEEVGLVSVAILYKNILSQTIHNKGIVKLINFELVGRMAALEAMVAEERSIKIESIQTALISSTPLPIFPHCNLFYTDGKQGENLLQRVGSANPGNVKYFGPPYNINPIISKISLEKISFFTQPYEPFTTMLILSILCEWARSNKSKIILRLHPRDNFSEYKKLLTEYEDIINLDSKSSLNKAIVNSDLVITRTSSVAKEALALGIPILLCLWTSFDQNINADYRIEEDEINNVSYKKTDLIDLLNSPYQLLEAAQVGQDKVFGNLRINNLVTKLLS